MAHILVIDDDPDVQNIFAQFLEKTNHNVEYVLDGKEGLKKMLQHTPDLIITDILMPEMDGLEVLQNIRDHHPGLPVIAISGGAKRSEIDFLPVAKQFGACKALEKPISKDALLQAIEELLPDSAKG